jgi:hypothetical protein
MHSFSRRNFPVGAPLAATALAADTPAGAGGKPAILGGPRAFTGDFPDWRRCTPTTPAARPSNVRTRDLDKINGRLDEGVK